MGGKIHEARIEDFVQDENNFNKGTERGKKLHRKSIKTFGAGRSIVVDRRNRIIAGNKTQERALEAGLRKAIVVDAAADELVVVRRSDVDIETREGREMALADNAVSCANLVWNEDALQLAEQEVWLSVDDWGVSLKEESGNVYSRKVEIPLYEPSGECPSISDCYDTTKVEELVANIKKAKIPKEVKDFLLIAAYRHAEFNYGLVADFYSHAPKEVQELFEDSALVVIDFNAAIEKGFIKLTGELKEEYAREYGEGL